MKELNWHGRLRYWENAYNPDMPDIQMWGDWRFISTTLKDYMHFCELVHEAEGRQFDENTFRAGHLNYVIAVIQMLYAMDRQQKAQELLDQLKKDYKLKGEDWDLDLDQFVVSRINQEGNREGSPPTPELAAQQITAALVTSFARQAAGDKKGSLAFFRYAKRFWDAYQAQAVRRLREKPVQGDDAFQEYRAGILGELLINPAIHGHKIDLVSRSSLFAQQDIQTQMLLYDYISPFLRDQCRTEGLDFNKAFPEPAHMQEFRDRSHRQLGPPPE